MRAKQALRPCVALLVALVVSGPPAAAIAQPRMCDTLPDYQREFARAIGACRDPAPIIDVAPPSEEATPSPASPMPKGATEAMQTTASPTGAQATKLAPPRTEARKSPSKATAGPSKNTAQSKWAASGKSEGDRRSEPLDQRGWQAYQDNRYAFRYPAGLATTSHPDGAVELHSADGEFRIRASSRVNSEKATVQSAWQQRLEEGGGTVTYKRKADGWFVVSGVEDGKTYYRKYFVSPERTAELVITYPRSRASVYDPWVTEIEKSFVAYRLSNIARASGSTERSDATSAPAVSETLELPNVIGRSYADAASALTEFKVERVEVASEAPSGEILEQIPAAGIGLAPGSTISLRVSDGSLARATAAVPMSSAPSVAPTSQPEASTAPVPTEPMADAFVGEIGRNVAAALVTGVLLGLLLGAVLMRRALVARGRAIATAPADHAKIAPAEVDRSEEAEVARVVAIERPPEMKFAARLDPGETTIRFIELPEYEEVSTEYSTDQFVAHQQGSHP